MSEIKYTTLYDRELDEEIEVFYETTVEDAIKEAEQDKEVPQDYINKLKEYSGKGLWCAIDAYWGYLVYFDPATREVI